MFYNFTVIALAMVTAAAAASAAGYQTMAPTGQWYGKTFTGLRRGSKQLALTYDDGPNDPHTLRLLDVLAKHRVRATFFLIGKFVQQRPDIVREIHQAGHIIANHTFSHPNLIFTSAAGTRKQIVDCEGAIEQAIGTHSRLFRPPFGGRRPVSLRIARDLGLTPVMWSVTAYDWKPLSAGEIEGKVAGRARGGDVILMHDGGHERFGTDRSQTVIATDRLIGRYKAEGFQFVTVEEMMSPRVEAFEPVRRISDG